MSIVSDDILALMKPKNEKKRTNHFLNFKTLLFRLFFNQSKDSLFAPFHKHYFTQN